MIRSTGISIIALVFLASTAIAADKEMKGTVVKVDVKAKQIIVKTEDGEKTFDVNDETKFLGPKGGLSDAGLKDDRLAKGTEIKLVIAGNNKTAREIHLPERKKKDK